MPYFPTVAITDQGQNEINAIQHAFDFKPRMFYCAWHVLQAWERNFTNVDLGMTVLSTAEKKARKDRIRKQLHAILYALAEEECNTLLVSFRDEWKHTAPKLLQYLDKNYLTHEADRKLWMLCHRQQVSYSYINTNNYIESWRNTLKKHFFKVKHQRRLDSVIHTLTKKAVPHFQ
ncbi:hypothetical protein BGZ47_002132 [Haplosporangium gracile]|nr:hypothetical protein BGZ47_002132 [Haplosporangium gracile]